MKGRDKTVFVCSYVYVHRYLKEYTDKSHKLMTVQQDARYKIIEFVYLYTRVSKGYKNVTICNSKNIYEVLRNRSNEMWTWGKGSKTLTGIKE